MEGQGGVRGVCVTWRRLGAREDVPLHRFDDLEQLARKLHVEERERDAEADPAGKVTVRGRGERPVEGEDEDGHRPDEEEEGRLGGGSGGGCARGGATSSVGSSAPSSAPKGAGGGGAPHVRAPLNLKRANEPSPEPLRLQAALAKKKRPAAEGGKMLTLGNYFGQG